MYTTPPLPLDPKAWKPELDEFRAKTDAFYAGQMEKAAYKGFSGYFGSYAQRGAAASMLRLRMPAGRVSGPPPCLCSRCASPLPAPPAAFHNLPDHPAA